MKRLILTSCLCVLFTAGFALADWAPGDPFKMHWPQLPDPYGWDIGLEHQTLADDWQCTESGPVDDVHFWVSWQYDEADWDSIANIHLSIHDNIATGPDGYSIPGVERWSANILPADYTVAGPWPGEQGFHCPSWNFTRNPDHYQYWQINVTDIPEPFYQVRDAIYWLDIRISMVAGYTGSEIGWKESGSDGFMDFPVWFDDTTGTWQPVMPEGEPVWDFAFVITPEPTTIALLGLGALGLLRRKRIG